MKIEQVNHPDGQVSYEITNGRGQTVSLTPEQALDMLMWLDANKGEFIRLLHLDESSGPDTDRRIT